MCRYGWDKCLTENDARRGDTFVNFGFDEAMEVISGAKDAGLILGLGKVVECYLTNRCRSASG